MGFRKKRIKKDPGTRTERMERREKRLKKNPFYVREKKIEEWKKGHELDYQQVPHDNALLQSKLLRLKEKRRMQRLAENGGGGGGERAPSADAPTSEPKAAKAKKRKRSKSAP